MERKIGEIFEYDGEWYQCVEQCVEHEGCHDCAFDISYGIRCSFNGVPHCSAYRSDGKPVIFKKLEKVGDTYEKRVSDGTFSTFQKYKVWNPVILPQNPYIYFNFTDSTIEIGIKQNKEDMEEKKQCGDNRFRTIARAKEHLFQATNIAEDKKELEVLDSFLLRCWQMGWLKQYEDIEESKSNLKPFDLEAAKANKPVCTRSGKQARIVCFDKVGVYSIIALVREEKMETCHFYSQDGKCADCGSEYDLVMFHQKKKGYVNVYSNMIYVTLEDADNARKNANNSNYIQTLEVEWEEQAEQHG